MFKKTIHMIKSRDVKIAVRAQLPFSGFKALLVTILALSFLAKGYAQALDKAKLDQFFDQLVKKNKAMGSLVIAKDGQLLYTRSIGFSQQNGAEKKSLTTETRMRVGSVTKMFTTALVLQLVEEGKMKLADRLDSFFPQIPNADKITIEQLLGHRSGIHDISEDRDFRSRRAEGLTKDELLALMVKSKPDFEPGAKFAYSNTSFQLLGMLVEKLTGTSYQKALAGRIAEKIGLHDTYAATGNIDSNKAENISYRFVTDWQPGPQTHASLLFGSGAVVSTSADLAKFIRALFEGKLVSQKSLAQMTAMKDGYGLGMDTFAFAGKTFYGHTGGIDNFGSWLAYLPDEKLTVVYVSNAKVYPVARIMDGVINIYYNKPFTIPSFETIPVSPEVLDKYVGVYSNAEATVKFIVSRNDTTLFVQMAGQTPVPLEPTAQDKFRMEPAGIMLAFDAAKNQMTIIRNGRERMLTKEK